MVQYHLIIGVKSMKRRSWLLIGLATVVLVVLATSMLLLLFSNPAVSNLSASSSVKDGLQLTISLTTTSFAKGDNIPIAFSIKNVGNQTLNFINTNGDANFNFQIYNSANDEVYSWIHGAYPSTNATMPLALNETFSQTLNWNQQSDLKNGFPQVPTGTYQIIGEIGANTPYQLQTQPLNITIC
jgi:hypothetical protein